VANSGGYERACGVLRKGSVGGGATTWGRHVGLPVQSLWVRLGVASFVAIAGHCGII
jgi:hypothetical protein